jgi:gas vesicle protein
MYILNFTIWSTPMKKANNLVKSILRTAVYFLDQSDRVASDVRDRVTDTVDRAADRVSELKNQAREVYQGQDHTVRNVLMFAAGVGVGVGAGFLLAPASGDELRGTISDRVHDMGDRVRGRFSSGLKKAATGTEGI